MLFKRPLLTDDQFEKIQGMIQSWIFSSCFLVVLIQANPLSEEIRPGRIVHGRDVALGEIKYQAALIKPDGFNFCGGTLIKEGWIMTAAHCTQDFTEKDINVVLGTIDLKNGNNPIFKVKKIHRYNYNSATKQGDVSLLQLEASPIQGRLGSPEIMMEPVNLPNEDFDPTGKMCTVSGWGRLQSGGFEKPTNLKMVEVLVPSNDVCGQMLPKNMPWDSEHNSMICAGGEDKDACQGDSGGPLVCPDEEGNLKISGIVSWGIGCATEGVPGVYTNVRKYVSWIKSRID